MTICHHAAQGRGDPDRGGQRTDSPGIFVTIRDDRGCKPDKAEPLTKFGAVPSGMDPEPLAGDSR